MCAPIMVKLNMRYMMIIDKLPPELNVKCQEKAANKKVENRL